MGSQEDWLARLLAITHWTKTMEKNSGSAQNAASNIPQTITRLYWNGQLLQGYVATQVAYFSTTHSQNRCTQEGWEISSISIDTRNAKGIKWKHWWLLMYYVHTLIITSFSISSLMHLITNLVRASCKEGKSAAYYSKKLNSAHMNYKLIKKSLCCSNTSWILFNVAWCWTKCSRRP